MPGTSASSTAWASSRTDSPMAVTWPSGVVAGAHRWRRLAARPGIGGLGHGGATVVVVSATVVDDRHRGRGGGRDGERRGGQRGEANGGASTGWSTTTRDGDGDGGDPRRRASISRPRAPVGPGGDRPTRGPPARPGPARRRGSAARPTGRTRWPAPGSARSAGPGGGGRSGGRRCGPASSSAPARTTGRRRTTGARATPSAGIPAPCRPTTPGATPPRRRPPPAPPRRRSHPGRGGCRTGRPSPRTDRARRQPPPRPPRAPAAVGSPHLGDEFQRIGMQARAAPISRPAARVSVPK